MNEIKLSTLWENRYTLFFASGLITGVVITLLGMPNYLNKHSKPVEVNYVPAFEICKQDPKDIKILEGLTLGGENGTIKYQLKCVRGEISVLELKAEQPIIPIKQAYPYMRERERDRPLYIELRKSGSK